MGNERHVGKTKRTKQGVTLRISRYINRENVQVEILETGEKKWITYRDFRKGYVVADFLNYPYAHDVSFGVAKFYIISIAILTAAFVVGIIYAMI